MIQFIFFDVNTRMSQIQNDLNRY